MLLLFAAGIENAPSAHALAAPANLRATAVSARAIDLAWKPAGGGMYRLRFSKSSTMANPKTWDVAENSYEWTSTDPNPGVVAARLSPSTTYYFQVKAVERAASASDRESLTGYSKVVAIKTATAATYPDLPPAGRTSTGGGADTVYVSWNTQGPGMHYALRYTTNPSAKVTKWTKRTLPVAGAAVTGLKPKTTYYFRVRVVDRSGKATSNYSDAWSRTTAATNASPGLNVVSYNVLKTGSGPTWASRRMAVAGNILRQHPDVIALQEAVGNKVTDSAGKTVPQYTDVLQLLGDPYRFVTTKGSGGTKLAYDSSRLTVVTADVAPLTTYGSATRYAVWSILQDKTSGKQFFALSTHLEPGTSDSTVYNDARIRQAQEVLALIAAQNTRKLPVVVAGDLNSSRATYPENGAYRVFTGAGLVDPLGRSQNSLLAGQDATAEHIIDGAYNSFNGFDVTARRTGYPIGTNVDYILVSGAARVAQWRTVVDVDSARRFVGTIPSDHNLITATVHLP